ncbi:hypothetical protein PHYBLDRAFT_98632, partial [Phycomyces blakesleeanus NRRL 1555(-)]
MPLDYSKWDNLELSDDSDIECHPNVDKRSMIKWKQESIHHERAERKAKIEHLEFLIAQQKRLAARLEALNGTLQKGSDEEEEAKKGDFRPTIPNPNGNGKMPDNIGPDQVFVMMMDQIEGGLKNHSPAHVRKVVSGQLQQTLEATNTNIQASSKELAALHKEADKKLTSENMFKETANRTILNTKSSSAPKEKKKEKVIETLNPSAQLKDLTPANSTSTQSGYEGDEEDEDADDEDDKDIELSPKAEAFSKLSGFGPSFKYISANPEIVNETISDQILAEAFTAQLKGRTEYAKNCVTQSLTLQYCGNLGKDGVNLFFMRMNGPNAQPRNMFGDDVKKTYERIVNRCAEILEERENEAPVETIQLQPMSDGSELTVRIPDPNNEEDKGVYEVFEALPEEFRKALATADLDKVNKVLEKMKVEDAEMVIQVCSEYGFLDVGSQVVDGT